jgi:hypothetical protein
VPLPRFVPVSNFELEVITPSQNLCISSLAQTDALAKLFIEKGVITREEFIRTISEEKVTYQKFLNPTPQ